MSQEESIYTVGTVRRYDPRSLLTPEGMYNFEPGEAIKWRYEAVSLIDKGSFGIVIKAKDCKTDQLVALKMSKINDESVKSEIDILGSLMNW